MRTHGKLETWYQHSSSFFSEYELHNWYSTSYPNGPRCRCATLDCSDQTIWVAHWWRGATHKYMVWETLESHDDLDNGRATDWSEGKVAL